MRVGGGNFLTDDVDVVQFVAGDGDLAVTATAAGTAVVTLPAGGGSQTVYVQDEDPGAVGPGKVWVTVTDDPPVLKVRNTADDDWTGPGGIVPQGGPLTDDLDGGGNSITNIEEITGTGSDWDTGGGILKTSGGGIDAGGAVVTGLDDPEVAEDAVPLAWANAHVGGVAVADQNNGAFWSVSGAGNVNTTDPAAYVNPATATAQQIAQALIDAGFMAAS